MKFGPVSLDRALGAVLAHSLQLKAGRLRKGRVLTAEDVANLAAAGHDTVIVARAEGGDVDENAAAEGLAAAILTPGAGINAEAGFTGRVNLRAEGPGILEVDAEAVLRINSVDPAITLATLPPWQRVTQGMMVGTVKIIPYAVPKGALDMAAEAASGALRLRAPVMREAGMIVTRLPGTKGEDKAISVTRARLAALDVGLGAVETVAHDDQAIAEALGRMPGDFVLIFTASATSDAADVGPGGLVAAGGVLTRFGMPVDPGNLMFLGEQSGRPVIGLPGCARSPALNGVDWVMERVICGVPVTDRDIAEMGVGGLLKEIPTRPQPRERKG